MHGHGAHGRGLWLRRLGKPAPLIKGGENFVAFELEEAARARQEGRLSPRRSRTSRTRRSPSRKSTGRPARTGPRGLVSERAPRGDRDRGLLGLTVRACSKPRRYESAVQIVRKEIVEKAPRASRSRSTSRSSGTRVRATSSRSSAAAEVRGVHREVRRRRRGPRLRSPLVGRLRLLPLGHRADGRLLAGPSRPIVRGPTRRARSARTSRTTASRRLHVQPQAVPRAGEALPLDGPRLMWREGTEDEVSSRAPRSLTSSAHARPLAASPLRPRRPRRPRPPRPPSRARRAPTERRGRCPRADSLDRLKRENLALVAARHRLTQARADVVAAGVWTNPNLTVNGLFATHGAVTGGNQEVSVSMIR